MINWKGCFPKGYQPREIQVKAIQFILKSFLQKNKRFVIVEATTGTGKSFIASTIAQYFNMINKENKSYIVTPQIILQKQYKKQFSNFANVSSINNYMCKVFKESNCGDMKFVHQITGIPKCQDCPYQVQKQDFMKNKISITNTAFMMSNILYSSQIIKKRSLLVVDQCHNLQQDIIRFNGLNISFKTLAANYSMRKQNWIKPGENIIDWLSMRFFHFLQDKVTQLVGLLQGNRIQLAQQKIIQISRRLDYIRNIKQKLQLILQSFDPDRWVIENNTQTLQIAISPIFASDYTQSTLFNVGDRILMMSGTILNKNAFCNNLGIKPQQCQFISLDSPFPVQNRRIFILGSGSMSKNNLEHSLPNVISDINKILQLHKGQRGIIHVSSHYLAKRIFDGLNSKRLIIIDEHESRDDMLQYHYNSDDTVLISPSMGQGVDLKQDLSRFQIIAKVPYPNLGSKYISTKKDLIKGWYSYQTVKALVQSYGRSIRSQDDFAVTYILDSDILNLFKFNKNLIPQYFMKAVLMGKL